MYYIYKYTNILNNKIYVGKTSKLNRRKATHKRLSKTVNSKFYNAIRKYGFESFSFEILEEVSSLQEANKKEILWISFYNSFINGYNSTIGGDGGDTSKSEAYILGMNKRRSFSGQNNPMYGKIPSNAKKIEFNGIIYNSIKHATDETKHSTRFIKKHGKIITE